MSPRQVYSPRAGSPPMSPRRVDRILTMRSNSPVKIVKILVPVPVAVPVDADQHAAFMLPISPSPEFVNHVYAPAPLPRIVPHAQPVSPRAVTGREHTTTTSAAERFTMSRVAERKHQQSVQLAMARTRQCASKAQIIKRGPRAVLHPHPAAATAAESRRSPHTAGSSGPCSASLSPPPPVHYRQAVQLNPRYRVHMSEPRPVSEVAAVPQRRPKDDEPHPVSEVAAVPQRRPKDDEPHPVSEVANMLEPRPTEQRELNVSPKRSYNWKGVASMPPQQPVLAEAAARTQRRPGDQLVAERLVVGRPTTCLSCYLTLCLTFYFSRRLAITICISQQLPLLLSRPHSLPLSESHPDSHPTCLTLTLCRSCVRLFTSKA